MGKYSIKKDKKVRIRVKKRIQKIDVKISIK